MSYTRQSVSEFADALGAPTPAPAAGSAIAVAAALAAALVELAGSVSGDETTAEQARRLRGNLLTLADEDADAYAAFLASRSDADRSRTIDVPLSIAEAARTVAALGTRVGAEGKPAVRGDALAATDLARAAVVAAARLVRLNLEGEVDARGARADELARAARVCGSEPQSRRRR